MNTTFSKAAHSLLALFFTISISPVLAETAASSENQTTSLSIQLVQAQDICRKAVYRYFADKPLGPQRSFSPQDIDVQINPALNKRLANNSSAEAAIRSAGSSFIWNVASKNARGYCDLPPTQSTLIKSEPFFQQAEKQPRIVISNWEPQ